MQKLKRRYKMVNKSKFALVIPIYKQDKRYRRETECVVCGDGNVTLKSKLFGKYSRLRVTGHQYECDTCGSHFSGMSSGMDRSLRAMSKVKVSRKKYGQKFGLPKRIKRRCKLTTNMWIRRCDRTDTGWEMGWVKDHFRR
jgi:hypothetical protein